MGTGEGRAKNLRMTSKWLPVLILAGWMASTCAVPTAVRTTTAAPTRADEEVLIAGTFSSVLVDKLDQLYTLDGRGQLVKYDPTGQFMFAYANTVLGAPTVVDVTNPLQLVLFYEEYQTIVLLDRTLSDITTLDLRAIPDLQRVTTAGRSFDDRIWVYDDWDRRLKLIDTGGQLLRRSDELQLLLDLAAPPQTILADETRVYLSFPGRGVAHLNNLAQFRDWLEWPDLAGLLYARGRFYLRDSAGVRAWSYGKQPSEARFADRPEVVPYATGYLRIGTEGVLRGEREE
jgi:hypothetical protein